jgi:hypothetical protein
MSSPDVFDRTKTKLVRAIVLEKSLKAEVSRAKKEGFELQLLVDHDEKKLLFAAKRVPAIPQAWTDSVADIMQNARNALDHLAFALAKIKSADFPRTEKEARAVQFPWSESKGKFDKLFAKNLLRPKDWETLEKLQIFNADRDDIWGPDHGVPLIHGVPALIGVLWTLANIDKHREHLPLWWGIGNTGGPPDTVDDYKTDGGSIPDAPMTAGYLFAEWRFEDGMPDRLEDSLVEKYLPIRLRITNTSFAWPAFGDIGFLMFDLEEIVEQALKAVATIFYIFEPALREGDDPRDVTAATDLGWR